MSFGKKYVDSFEFAKRYDNFRKSLEIIRAHNINLKATYKMGLNQFSDWTQGEIDSFLTLQVEKEERKKNYADLSQKVMKADVDWREKGIINKIKDQGSCGSCWAFSAIGAVEAAYAQLDGTTLPDLSEQLLVDCNRGTWIFGNQGCNGGLMNYAFDWLKTNQPALTSDYPYTAKDGTCNKSYKKFGLKLTGYTDVKENHNDLKKALSQQPVSVAIMANQDPWMKYQEGIITGCKDTRLDHGILAIGYGKDEDTKLEYVLVRNSWGERWGESGYARISTEDQSCGILQKASYPEASKA